MRPFQGQIQQRYAFFMTLDAFKRAIFILSSLISLSLLAQKPSLIKEKEQLLTEQQKDLYHKMGSQLRCPTCYGMSVLQSDAPFSEQIKNVLLDQVIEGKDEKSVIDFFTQRYGSWILREPPLEGFHLLAWLIPGMILLIGPLLIWLLFLRKKQTFSDARKIRSEELILNEMREQLAKRDL